MRYLCLICAETVMEDMTPDEAAAHFQDYAVFIDDIKASGHFVGGNRLKPAGSAATVRVRDGKTLVTDGPFAETKEQFGGYFLIEAGNLHDAIQVASRIPGARIGSVEVRPVADDPQTAALGLDKGAARPEIEGE